MLFACFPSSVLQRCVVRPCTVIAERLQRLGAAIRRVSQHIFSWRIGGAPKDPVGVEDGVLKRYSDVAACIAREWSLDPVGAEANVSVLPGAGPKKYLDRATSRRRSSAPAALAVIERRAGQQATRNHAALAAVEQQLPLAPTHLAP